MAPDIAALEAAVREHPENDETLSVYADALIAIGDRRGELAAIQRERAINDTVELKRAEAAFFERHGEELLGLLGDRSARPEAHDRASRAGGALGIPGSELGWHHGHVCSIVIAEPYAASPPPAVVLGDLLGRPVAQLARDIVLEETRGFACERVTADVSRRARDRGRSVLEAITAAPRDPCVLLRAAPARSPLTRQAVRMAATLYLRAARRLVGVVARSTQPARAAVHRVRPLARHSRFAGAPPV